jgi:hypothetical protein
MISLIAKFVLAAALTVASAAGLIGLSGLIIFADLKAPSPASVLQPQAVSSGTQPLPFTGR